MSFSYERQPRVFLNDTASLAAYLYEGGEGLTPVPESRIASAQFTVVKPSDDPNSPSLVGQDGRIVDDGLAQYVVSGAFNDAIGEYHGICVFTYTSLDGDLLTKSVICDFDCVDPFERAGTTPAQPSIDLCWTKIEDCFDSELGGPWLRDMTMARFDKSKLAALLPDVFFELNSQQPQTNFAPDAFTYSGDNVPLIAQGLMVHTIKHLMRSYTEQPDQVNSPVGFFDRKRYQQAWAALYTIEAERWKEWVFLSKIRIYNQMGTSTLVSSKAGRLLPAPLRSRYVGRGFY